jgi:hypothetical protein
MSIIKYSNSNFSIPDAWFLIHLNQSVLMFIKKNIGLRSIHKPEP